MMTAMQRERMRSFTHDLTANGGNADPRKANARDFIESELKGDRGYIAYKLIGAWYEKGIEGVMQEIEVMQHRYQSIQEHRE